MATEILDCGHEPTATAGLGTGYARTATGKRICYECAIRAEREYVARHDAFTGYLSDDGRALTAWPGGELAKVTRLGVGWRTKYGRMVYVTARTPDGRAWWGSSGNGRGGAVTMRIVRGKR